MTINRRRLIAGSALASLPGFRARGQTAAQAAAPIRIGVLTDLSGTFNDTSGPTSVACARQAIQDFVDGLKVELIQGDHQNMADVGASLARQWFDQGIDMIVDVPNSAVALAVKTIASEKNKAYLNAGAMTTALTGAGCAPTTIHWGYNTTSSARSAASMVKQGGASWFFIIADYTFGHEIAGKATRFVKEAGGRVIGTIAYPFPNTTDFSSLLLQAQASGADVIAFANAGMDSVNCIKQAHEFGLAVKGKKLTAMASLLQNVRSLGLETAQGLLMTESYYWDLNDRTRGFMARIAPKLRGNYVSSEQAATYGSTLHYLKAVADVGAAQAKANGSVIIARMKAMPTDDDCFGRCSIRSDGQVLTPAYLFEVKKPEESKGPWDLYKLLQTTSGEDAAPDIETCRL